MATRITQSLIYQELISIKEKLEAHSKMDTDNFQELRALLEGTPQTPGMKIRVDRLEQDQIAKRRHFGYLWTIVSGLVVAVAAAFLK